MLFVPRKRIADVWMRSQMVLKILSQSIRTNRKIFSVTSPAKPDMIYRRHNVKRTHNHRQKRSLCTGRKREKFFEKLDILSDKNAHPILRKCSVCILCLY